MLRSAQFRREPDGLPGTPGSPVEDNPGCLTLTGKILSPDLAHDDTFDYITV
jgi:hypothetical protein